MFLMRTTAGPSPGPTSLGMRPLSAHCHLGFGRLHERAGGGAKARDHPTIAPTMYDEMGMNLWLEKARMELGPSPKP